MNNLSIEAIKKSLSNKLWNINANTDSQYLGVFIVNCKRLVEYIETNPILKSLIAKIEEEEIDFDKWTNFLKHGHGDNDYLGLEKDTHISWRVLKTISEKNFYPSSTNRDISESHKLLIIYGSIISSNESGSPSRNNHIQVIVNRYIEPLIDYLADKLNTELGVIYNLERFVRRCREFDKKILSDMYESNTQSGEKKLDTFLRRYLFDQGIDTISASEFYEGRTDIIIESNNLDSVIIEIKLFKNEGNYKEDYLKSGFSSQLQPAVNHHGRTYGILFTFNLSDKYLEFITNDGGSPPKMIVGGKTYYLIHTDIYDKHASSSKAKVETIKIDCRNWIL